MPCLSTIGHSRINIGCDQLVTLGVVVHLHRLRAQESQKYRLKFFLYVIAPQVSEF